MSLSKPPQQDAPRRAVGRILFLLVLLLAAGAVIYTFVVNQRLDAVETRRAASLELTSPSEVGDLTINVTVDQGSGTPVVLLHDADVTGGLLLSEVSQLLADGYFPVRIDMPGFGLSDRMPFETQAHTASGMAAVMADVIEERFSTPVVVVGVGYGGEVAAELGHSYPELVRGVVLVDVDFWAGPTLPEYLMRVPWFGTAATYTWETGGQLALDGWQPFCDVGGWCASPQHLADRALYLEIDGSTESIRAFHLTADAALAPANLGEISVPVAYVWSVEGVVAEGTVDRVASEINGLIVFESVSFQAHLEDPTTIVDAVAAVST